MLSFNRNTKIFLAVFAILVLLGIIFFFVLKSRTSTSPIGSTSSIQLPSTLPSSSTQTPPPSNQTTNQPPSTAPPTQKPFPANEYSLQKQEADSYDTLKNDPNLIASAQNIKGDFKLGDMGTSFPSATAKLQNGDEILILSGCEPHNCGGTEKIIAYDKKTRKSYIFVEKYGTAMGYEIIGNPSAEIKDLLIFYYKYK